MGKSKFQDKKKKDESVKEKRRMWVLKKKKGGSVKEKEGCEC